MKHTGERSGSIDNQKPGWDHAVPASHKLCEYLASQNDELKKILEAHSYSPMWTWETTFGPLVHIILEKQVSLASSLATRKKLKEKATEIKIMPDAVPRLSDEGMRACLVSRQKNAGSHSVR